MMMMMMMIIIYLFIFLFVIPQLNWFLKPGNAQLKIKLQPATLEAGLFEGSTVQIIAGLN